MTVEYNGVPRIKMMKITCGLVLALVIAGCQSTPSEQEAKQMQELEEWCQQQGIPPGTEAFETCVAQQAQRLGFTRQQIHMRRGG